MQSQSPEQRRISSIEVEINSCGSTTGKSPEVQRLARALNEKDKVLVDVLREEFKGPDIEVLDAVMASLDGLTSYDGKLIQAFWAMDYNLEEPPSFENYVNGLNPELTSLLTENKLVANSTVMLAVSSKHIEAVRLDIGPDSKVAKLTLIVNTGTGDKRETEQQIKDLALTEFKGGRFRFLFDPKCVLDLNSHKVAYEVVMPCRMFTSYKCGQTTLINILQHILGGNCEINLAKSTEKEVAGYYLDLAEILLAGKKVYQGISKITPQLQAIRQEAVKSEAAWKFQQEHYQGLLPRLEAVCKQKDEERKKLFDRIGKPETPYGGTKDVREAIKKKLLPSGHHALYDKFAEHLLNGDPIEEHQYTKAMREQFETYEDLLSIGGTFNLYNGDPVDLNKAKVPELRSFILKVAKKEDVIEVEDGTRGIKDGSEYSDLFTALTELKKAGTVTEVSVREAKQFIMEHPRNYPAEKKMLDDLQGKVRRVGESYKARYQGTASAGSAQKPAAAGPARATTQPAAPRSTASSPSASSRGGQQPAQAPRVAAPAPEADIKEHIEYIGKQQNLSEATIKFAQQINQDKRLTDFDSQKAGEIRTDACLLHIVEGLNELEAIKEKNIKFINYSIDCSLADITPEFVFDVMMPQEGKEFFQPAIPGAKLCMFYTSALNSYDPNNAEHRAAGVAHTIAVVFRVNEQKKIEITYCEAPGDTAIALEEQQVRERERLPMFLKPEFYQQAKDIYGFAEIEYSKTRTAQPYQFGINMGCAHTTVICGLMNALGDNFLVDKNQRTNAEEAKHFLDIATLELGTEAQKEELVGSYMEIARGGVGSAINSSIVLPSPSAQDLPDLDPDLLAFIHSGLRPAGTGPSEVPSTGHTNTVERSTRGIASWPAAYNGDHIETSSAPEAIPQPNSPILLPSQPGPSFIAGYNALLGASHGEHLDKRALTVSEFEGTVAIYEFRGEEGRPKHPDDALLSRNLKIYYPGTWELPRAELIEIYSSLRDNKQAIIATELNGTKTIQQHIEELVKRAQERIEGPVQGPSSPQSVIPAALTSSITSSILRNENSRVKGHEKLKSHELKAFRENPKVWIHSASLALAIGCGAIGAYLLATDKNLELSTKKLVGVGLIVLAAIMVLVVVVGLVVNKINNAKSSAPSTEVKNPSADCERGSQKC